jgi:hypothetical protein
MLKNKSYFKKSTGDEAATRALGMGVVSHEITGKAYFASWSMNVKIEGLNAMRHLDLTTHNHLGAMPGNTPVWPHLDAMAVSLDHPCVDDARREFESCKGYRPYGDEDPCPPGKAPTAPVVDAELAGLRQIARKALTASQRNRKGELTKAYKSSAE